MYQLTIQLTRRRMILSQGQVDNGLGRLIGRGRLGKGLWIKKGTRGLGLDEAGTNGRHKALLTTFLPFLGQHTHGGHLKDLAGNVHPIRPTMGDIGTVLNLSGILGHEVFQIVISANSIETRMQTLVDSG